VIFVLLLDCRSVFARSLERIVIPGCIIGGSGKYSLRRYGLGWLGVV
jgi:hypothetical protein